MRKVNYSAFKNWLILSFIGFLCLSLVSCNTSSTQEKLSYSNAQDLLQAIWNKESEKLDTDQKKAIVGGYGDEANIVQSGPGLISLDHPEEIAVAFSIPQLLVDSSQNAASIMNEIMPNYFTASVWQLDEEVDGSVIMEKVARYLGQNHWIDSFPDKYVVFYTDPFIIVCYGLEESFDSFYKACEEILTTPDGTSIEGDVVTQ